jgi:hypothetical protein
MFRRFALAALVSVTLSLVVTAVVRLRELQRTWGIRPDDVMRPMPGDELVVPAPIVETRSIDIDAPPDAVWPWLVQMGYERAGWYSYDRMDMRGSSADRILPEHQSLAAGDIVPTHPGGGFRVEEVEPGRSLVLYLDTPLVMSQAAAQGDEATPAGLKAAGAMGEATMPEFRASWAFLLEPLSDHRTRLVERFRVWTPVPTPMQKLGLPLMGTGVFLMTRKHMLGLKERAEHGPAAVPAEAGSAAGA